MNVRMGPSFFLAVPPGAFISLVGVHPLQADHDRRKAELRKLCATSAHGLSHCTLSSRQNWGCDILVQCRTVSCPVWCCCAPFKMWTGSLVSWMQETHWIYSKLLAAEDSRGSLTRVTSECAWMSLQRGRLEAGWTLCRKDSLHCSTNCPEI